MVNGKQPSATPEKETWVHVLSDQTSGCHLSMWHQCLYVLWSEWLGCHILQFIWTLGVLPITCRSLGLAMKQQPDWKWLLESGRGATWLSVIAHFNDSIADHTAQLLSSNFIYAHLAHGFLILKQGFGTVFTKCLILQSANISKQRVSSCKNLP